jgi:hypothetical protein
MGARETSLNNAVIVLRYGFGFWFCGMGLFLFNREHPYASGFISVAFFISGAFFLSVGRVKPEKEVIKYQRWISWRVIAYSEIRDCGVSWVFGYIRLREYVFPWGRLFFVRPHSADSLFGWDKELISTIRSKAHI